MSLSISKNYSHAGFVKTTIYNSKKKYVRAKKIDLRIYFCKVIVSKVSYFWNDSKPKRLIPKSIYFEDQTYYFSGIRIPDKIGKNNLTVCVELLDLDGNIHKDIYAFEITVER